MKSPLMILFVAAMCSVGTWFFLQSRPSPESLHVALAATPIANVADTVLPDPTPTAVPMLVVDVEGAVRYPGLHRLHSGARVNDAVLAAGGIVHDADIAAVDRAELLDDGKEIIIPTHADVGERNAVVGVVDSVTSHRRVSKHMHRHRRHKRAILATPQPQSVSVDLNTASAADLAKLPGLNLLLASRIVVLRSVDGGFDSLDDLLDVQGMNDARLERVVPFLRVAS